MQQVVQRCDSPVGFELAAAIERTLVHIMRLRLTIVGVLAVAGPAVSAEHGNYEAMFALRSSKGFQAALDTATGRLSADPRDRVALGVRALVFGNAVDFLGMAFTEAKKAKRQSLAQALEIAPDAPWTRAAYGLIHQADDPVSAEGQLRQCIDENPGFIECYNLYGDLPRKTGRQQQAGDVYSSALRRWPNDGELLVSYALHLQEAGEVGRAIGVLRQLIADQPDFARGHWHLATTLYETRGDVFEARQAAQRALELDPLIWNGRAFQEALDRKILDKSTDVTQYENCDAGRLDEPLPMIFLPHDTCVRTVA